MVHRHMGAWLAQAILLASVAHALAADDGRRAVNVERYGVRTRVPSAWRLIEWGRDEYAFVLRLPQDAGSEEGYVRCELGLAPEKLADYQKRQEAAAQREAAGEQQARELLENKLEPINAERWGADLAGQASELLTSVWETTGRNGRTWYEVNARMVVGETMYTFVLTSDEAHFDAYRADFNEMLAACRFSPPEIGVQRMPGGYWMQRDFHFALKLPEGWKPSFGPNDKVLFFASGKTHEVFTDNLIVLASLPRPLELEALKQSLPEEIKRLDPQATVTCHLVPQGKTTALETVIRTRRGPFEITILERRFSGETRNYEVKFTCRSAEFDQHQDEYRKALDTFVEVRDVPKPADA